jgi:integrase
MLEAYCETLSQAGKASHSATLALFHRHLRDPHPRLWIQAARSVTGRQIVEVLDRLVSQQKVATAAKLRSSLNAAFNRALKADLCVHSPLMRRFGVTQNPIAPISPISTPQSTEALVLTIGELRALWASLDHLRTPAGAILRFYLLTGGQRLAQLLRARPDDLVADGVMLYDPKGRRSIPRPHLVPIIAAAREALAAVPGEGAELLNLKPGAPAPHPATLFRHLQTVTEDLVHEGRARPGINFAALRRTIETQLAAAGVPALVRAHLQSHDLGGVQARHYDRYSYLKEKRAALETLFHVMAGGDAAAAGVAA